MSSSSRSKWVRLICVAAPLGCAAQPLAAKHPAMPESDTLSEQPRAVKPLAQSPSGQDKDTEESTVSVFKCTNQPCELPKSMVTRLCSRKNPDLAVAMFAADTRWQRGYIRVAQVDAFNTLGGPSGEDKLLFDEEVIVLDGTNASKTQMTVSGSDGHHVLRLDGTCATVSREELTETRPPSPHHARLSWISLDHDTQEALLEDSGVKAARKAQRSACQGSWLLAGNEHCTGAREKLADAIEKAIQRPLALPEAAAFALR